MVLKFSINLIYEKAKDIKTCTPHGLIQYKHLIFRVKNVFEDYQKIVLINITHDNNNIFVHAINQNEHLQWLQKVFDKIWEKGLKLNLKKCEFGKASIN